MSDRKLNKNKDLNEDDAEGGASGDASGIEFRDFVTPSTDWRDDQLPFDEKKRLLIVHQDIHELKVKAQKDKRDQYKELKQGKMALQDFRNALGASAQYKANPILANKAQFSGIDRQVNQLPNENVADTNPEKRDELRNELRNELTNRLQHQAKPSFNPKPRGPGY